MNIEICKMDIQDLENMNLEDFDDFWNFNILKNELLSDSSYYIIAKSQNDIIGFAGLNFILDEAHVANIVTKKNKRSFGVRLKNARNLNRKSK